MQVLIDPWGRLLCLYAETLPLASLGTLSIRRASHVEPEGAGWYADLALSQGPKLGPFALRSEALRAEADWLEQQLGLLVATPADAG